jgi:hypothetical protein
VLDIADATLPLVVGELATNVLQSLTTGFQDVALDSTGTRAVAAMGTAGVWVIDLANPAAPRVVGSYDTPGTAWGVALAGTVAYVADGSSGLRVLSLTNPSQPALLGTLSLSGVMRDIAVSGSTAYLANQQGGIRVVNVADPRAPAFVASVAGSSAFRLSVSGTRLGVYQPNTTGGAVAIFNVANPASPQLLTTLDLYDARGVTLAGSLAYVPDGSAGVSVYSLGSGSTATLLSTVPLVGSAGDVDIDGARVHAADSLAGVAILQ